MPEFTWLDLDPGSVLSFEILEEPYVVYDDPLAGAVCLSSVSPFHAKQHKTAVSGLWLGNVHKSSGTISCR